MILFELRNKFYLEVIIIESLVNALLENIFYFNYVCTKNAVIGDWHDDKIKEITEKIGERQQDILFILMNTNYKTTKDIIKVIGISKSSISLTISKMVKSGLVEKSYSNKMDSRIVDIVVTEKGEKIYNELRDYFINFMDTRIKELDTKEKEILSYGFEQVSNFADIINIPELKVDNINSIDFEKFMYGLNMFKFMAMSSTKELRKNIKCSISPNDSHILELIYTHKINTPKDISNIVMKSESAVSCQLSNLVKKKYLVREKKEDDIRKTFFYLTEKGIQEHKLIEETIKACSKDILTSIDEKVIKSLNECLVCFISFFNLLNKKERGHN